MFYLTLLLKSILTFVDLDIVPVSDAGKGEFGVYKDSFTGIFPYN